LSSCDVCVPQFVIHIVVRLCFGQYMESTLEFEWRRRRPLENICQTGLATKDVVIQADRTEPSSTTVVASPDKVISVCWSDLIRLLDDKMLCNDALIEFCSRYGFKIISFLQEWSR
jgi:hypothetical protein